MSEITRGVMGMPYEMAMGSDLSRRQFYAIAREVYAQNGRLRAGVESDMAEIDRIQAAYDDQFRKCRELKAENESLRKGWYLNECGDNKFWPEEMEELKAESEALRKAITDIYEALYREYWSEYAGLDDTRAILDAALGREEKS